MAGKGHSFAPAGDAPGRRIARAMLDLVAERGYRAATVAEVISRAGVDRDQFDRRFASKEDCYFRIYEALARELGDRLRAAFSLQRSWREGIWAAGVEARRFFQEDPARPRFMLIEARAVGDRAAGLHDRLIQRQAELIDRGRQELDDPRSVPRSTAEGLAGAIEGMMLARLQRGRFEGTAVLFPQLMYMTVRPYLGESVARQELRRAAAA